MKRDIITFMVFLVTLIAITIPAIMLTLGAQTDTFSVSTTVGNDAPVISWVNGTGSDSPNAATTKIIQIRYNVTDVNGVDDINDSSAFMNITNGGVTRTSTSCTAAGLAGIMESFLCNITINYYETPGEWVIEAYIRDNGGSPDTNDTSNFTMGNTDDVDVLEGSLSFSGSAGEENVSATENPLTINNTGNQAYSSLNLTGVELTGGGDVIGAGNFSVNVSDSSDGQTLVNNTDISITGSSLAKRTGASSTEDLYFYLDIPSGINATTYNSGSNCVIDPII